MKRIIKYIIVNRLIIFISIVLLFLLESISSIAYYQRNKTANHLWSSSLESLERVIGLKDPHSSSYEKINEMNFSRSNGKKVYPNYLHEPQRHQPFGPYFLTNVTDSDIIDCNEAGYYSRWHSDFYGFRNPINTYKSQSDIILIGDSFTEGACENENGTIAGHLRSLGYNVANLGKGGSGPLHQLAVLVEYAVVFPTKTVVWVIFTGNDLQNLREEKTTILAKYLEESFSQNLVQRKELINKNLKAFLNSEIRNNNLRIERKLPLIRIGRYVDTLDLMDAKKKEVALLRKVASRFHSEVKKANAELKIVIINHLKYNHPIQDLTSETIKSFAASQSLQYLEFSRGYLEKNKKIYTKAGAHFSMQGYQSIGEEINIWLNDGSSKRL